MISVRYSEDELKDVPRLLADCRAVGVLLSKEADTEVVNGSISGPLNGEYVVEIDTPETLAAIENALMAQGWVKP